MTLTRPPYVVTAENLTAGWSYSCTHGDDSTLVDDVQLADGLTFTWSFTNGLAPGHLDPDQISFKLYARSADVLPSIDVGDLVRVTCERPLAVGDPKVYFMFEGRLAEPQLDPIRERGIIATLMATGLLVDLDGVTITGPKWPEETDANREGRIATLGQLNLDSMPNSSIPLGAMDVDARSALELIYEGLDALSTIPPYFGRVMVGRIGPNTPYEYPFGHSDIYFSSLLYFPTDTATGNDAPFKLVKDGLVAELQAQPIDTGDARVISAELIEFKTSWRKDKADAINTATLTGITNATIPDNDNAVVATYPDLVAKYGEIGRTITTQLLNPKLIEGSVGGYQNPAQAFLPDYDDATPDWSVEGLTIRPSLMTDAELDRYAATFFQPLTGGLPRRIIIPDVDDQVAVHGAAITGLVTGVTFAINRGELTISPNIRNETANPATFSDGITWSDLAADVLLEGTTADNPAVLHIDPNMTWRDIALATI